jgi:hypothetical protein
MDGSILGVHKAIPAFLIHVRRDFPQFPVTNVGMGDNQSGQELFLLNHFQFIIYQSF